MDEVQKLRAMVDADDAAGKPVLLADRIALCNLELLARLLQIVEEHK